MAKAKTLESVDIVKEVPVSFWQTTYGLLVKRIAFLVVSAVISGLVAELAKNPALFGALTPLVYTILTVVRDMLDPKLPNTTNSVVVK